MEVEDAREEKAGLKGQSFTVINMTRQGCVSKAISYPTLNSGCSTVVFSSRAHEDSLGDSEKTNKQTKTLSMKNKFIGNIQVCLPRFFSSAML